MSGLAQGNKLCEICRQPYKGAYKDPPSKPAPSLAGPAAAALRGATLMPQSLVQLATSHRFEVSTAAAYIVYMQGDDMDIASVSHASALKWIFLCLCLQQAISRTHNSDGSKCACSWGHLFCLGVCFAAGLITKSMIAQPGAP